MRQRAMHAQSNVPRPHWRIQVCFYEKYNFHCLIDTGWTLRYRLRQVCDDHHCGKDIFLHDEGCFFFLKSGARARTVTRARTAKTRRTIAPAPPAGTTRRASIDSPGSTVGAPPASKARCVTSTRTSVRVSRALTTKRVSISLTVSGRCAYRLKLTLRNQI